MKFAKIVFNVAGVWGFLVLTPLYFLFDRIGIEDPPAITHPGFYYGFVGTALAWQVVFFIVASDPKRFRPLMIPAMLEKIAFAIPALILFAQHRFRANDLIFAGADLLLCVLFLSAFVKTRR